MKNWLAVLLLPFALSGVVQAQSADTPDQELGAFEMLIEATKAAQTEAAECDQDRAACDAAMQTEQSANARLWREAQMLRSQLALVNRHIAAIQAALAEKEAQRAEAIRTAPQHTIEQIVRGEVLKPTRTLIADALVIADRNDAIAAADAEEARTTQIPVVELVNYLPSERIKALQKMGTTALTVIKAEDGSIAYVYAPSTAGNAPLNWRGTGLEYVAFVNMFANLNPEAITIDRGKVDWSRTKPGFWKIPVVKAEQVVEAKPKSSPKRAASKRPVRPAKAPAHTAQKPGNRFPKKVRDLAAEETAAMRGQTKPAAAQVAPRPETAQTKSPTTTGKPGDDILAALAKGAGSKATPEQVLASFGKPGGIDGGCKAKQTGPCILTYGKARVENIPFPEWKQVVNRVPKKKQS